MIKQAKQPLLILTLAALGLCAGAPHTALGAKAAKNKASAGVHPIVTQYGCVVGGWASGQWMGAEKIEPLVKGGETYAFYSLSKRTASLPGGKPEWDVPGLVAPFQSYPPGDKYAMGVAAPWNALPRVPKVQSTDQKTYKDEAARILKENGLGDAPVTITQVVRMDLEGDGVEEAVIAAMNMRPMPVVTPEKNEYSLVFLRRIVNGKVQTTLLADMFYPKTDDTIVAEQCRLQGVLDLNGDGVQEIAVYCEYYEGDGLIVYQVQGGKVTPVVNGGCGV
jgi:hypothetical protein